MTFEPGSFRNRMQVLVELEGTVLTDRELTKVAEAYPLCRGIDRWDVREYARRVGPGAREYRVVRGSSPREVYTSAERVSATAVQAALNEMETQDRARGDIG